MLVAAIVHARLRIVAFASFSTSLACLCWLLARDRFLHLARTFAREVLQRIGRGARFAFRAQAVTARRCCNARFQALSFFQAVHPNYSLKRTAANRYGVD